jgi:hypothetical protein
VLAVSFDSDAEQFREFIKENMAEWNHSLIVNGFDSDIAKQFEIASIPRTILIDQAGVARLWTARRQSIQSVARSAISLANIR